VDLRASVARGAVAGLKVLWELAKVMIPVVVAITVLDRSGILDDISRWLGPVMGVFGLPGESALVLVTANFTSVYAGLATMLALDLTLKQKSILGAMMLICHAAISETALLSKAGASGAWVLTTRFVAMVLTGLLMNWLWP